jgi:Secretion system C-terminal sorting domain/Ig-like domain CHU_C associated
MKKTLLLLLLSLCFFFVQAQNEVTIGTATTNATYCGPTYISSATSTYLYSNHINLFTPAEISVANVPLTGFSWEKANTEGYNLGNAEFRIYVKHSSLTSIPSTAGTFATELAGATLVYESTTQNLPLAAGWVDFDCNTANNFIYNGTDNLMILIDWYRPGAPTGAVPWYYTTTTGMGQTWANAGTPPTQSHGTDYRPNIKIRYVGTPNVTPSSITMNCGDTAVFTASGSTGFYQWYSDSLGQHSIGSDSILQLGPLCSDATVYVAALDAGTVIETYDFTNCATTGPNGPIQTAVNTAYSGTSLDGDVTINTQGIQEWIVPQDGVYKIEAYGAQGGPGATYDGGNGAYMNGDFYLTQGETLFILVGQMGLGLGDATESTGGGGGGSFIATGSTISSATPLLIAGGGGGSSPDAVADGEGMDAVTTQDGTLDREGSSVPGTNGNGGEDGCSTSANVGGGGGGFYTNGVNLPTSHIAITQGFAFVNGGQGAANTGGFGGGGGNDYGGAWVISGSGGGGYSGGAGGNRGCLSTSIRVGGGAGGSYNAGANQNNIAGANTGVGYITITQYGTLSSPLVSAQVTILPIADPIVTSPTSVCEMDSVLLTATGSTGNYLWSADSLGNTLLEEGATYQSGAILSDTVFYVQAYSDSINQTYSFTNCAATGSTGPTQANIDAAYSTSILNGNVSITTQGIQEWIVPYTGIYTIEAVGAQGYGPYGGRGALMSGEFNLTVGDTLKILVGQEAGDPLLGVNQYGGGGGSFVTYNNNTPLIIAGGGGGNWATAYTTTTDAPTTNNGNSGMNGPTNGTGGTAGSGGADASSANGGAGITGDGGGTAGGTAFINGGEGGADRGQGGFGGGGGTSSYDNRRSGGGGGYSGGGGAGSTTTGFPEGGGGGSYNTGTNQNNTAGINTGHGYVTIKVYAPLCYSSIIPVIVTTDTAPEITTQAVNAAVVEGNNASFSITATGTALNYQWQESTDSSTSWTNLVNNATYSGVTTAMLTITSATVAMDNYYYRCIVDGTCSPADTSTNAILEVQVSGINSYAINGINVYPNPVENTLIIEIDSKIEDNANLSIYDIIGNAILEYPDISIAKGVNRIPVDVQTLAKGVYYLRVLIGDEQLQYSIIKK